MDEQELLAAWRRSIGVPAPIDLPLVDAPPIAPAPPPPKPAKVTIVRAIDGAPMCTNDLPPHGFAGRWTSRVKANLLLAITGGLITRQGAIDRYRITEEEMQAWERDVASYGPGALRATKRHKYQPERSRWLK